MFKRIDHIGIVVENLEKAMGTYAEAFGLDCVRQTEIEEVGLRIAVLRAGDLFVELLEYRDQESEMVKSLKGDQKGINHICYAVEQFDETMERLKAEGFQLIEGFPRKGVHGRIAFFIPPHSQEERIEILEVL